MNIVSIEQPNEVRYRVGIDDGVMYIWEPGCHLLAKVTRVVNWLFVLNITFDLFGGV